MREVFEKLIAVIKYYQTLVDKDPFVMLNLKPLDYVSQKSELPLNKYSNFLKEYGNKYLQDIINCFLDLPKIYYEILYKVESEELLDELKKNKGFKISEAKPELSPNIMFKSIYDKYDFDKFKAAYNYHLAVSFYKEKKYQQANKALEEAINYDPNNPFVINNFFITNYLLGNFENINKISELMLILGITEIKFFQKFNNEETTKNKNK